MTRKYSTTHCLDLDEDGVASALVTVRLQGVSLLRATMFVDAVLATAGEYVLEEDRPTIQPPPICETVIRPQTPGPCVHLDQIATDDPEEIQALGVACRHLAGECPHMDNPEITCPIHDACEAMYCVMRARDECEAEQEEQVCSLCGYYDERSEHVDNIDPCTHPDACEGGCPYLDDDGIYCPQKEELAWAWGDDIPKFVPLAQDPEGWGTDMVAEAPDTIPRSDYVPAPEDPQAQAADAVYETETPAIADPGRLHTYVVEPEPEFPEPAPEEEPVYEAPPPVGEMRLDARGWTPEEERALRGATTPAEAVALYRAAYPGSSRTDAAIKSRYHKKIRPRRHGADGPLPDFAGDTVPVTQCDEAAIRRPRFKAGDRVRISHPAFKGYTGTIRRYYAATANYLTNIDGTTDTMWLSEENLEAA